MRGNRERTTILVSAPLMLAGLAMAAIAQGWVLRLSGAAMVIGASTALALTDPRGRRAAWLLAALGGLAALAACLLRWSDI